MVLGMTAKETIQRFGGSSELARKLGLSPSATRNWAALGFFPTRHYLQLSALAKKEQIFLDEALFESRSASEWIKGEKQDGKAAAE